MRHLLQVLVEKLLRVTRVLRVVVLIRPKRGLDTPQRLAALLQSSVFDMVRDTDPALLDKVDCVAGDITEDRLGLSEADREHLVNTVNIIFHCAATVRFDEDLTKVR